MKQRHPRQRDKSYLGAIAQMPSVISGQEPCECAHIRYGDPEHGKPMTGMGEKPDDRWVLPLTPEEHRLANDAQHRSNERAWWRSKGLNPLILCRDLYEIWSNGKKDVEALSAMRSRILKARVWQT